MIVNRVHPETGIAAKLSNDHLKLSAWAEEFERRQGQIRCEQRVENNALRRQGEFVKDRDSQHAAEFHRWRQERVATQHDRRAVESAALDARHERERDQLRIARDRLVAEQRERLKEANRPAWRDLYAIQRQERERLEAAQRSTWARLRHFVRSRGEEFREAGKGARGEMLKGAFAALIGSKSQYVRLEEKQEADRALFSKYLRQRTEELTKKINEKHEQRLAELRERQGDDRHDLRMRQSRQSQAEAREIREGRDKEVYQKEKGPSLRERLAAAQREAAKNSERGKGSTESARDTEAVPSRPGGPEKPKGESLSEKFAKAREHDPAKGRTAQKTSRFRQNARDAGQDIGRERSRSRKPPKPK